MPEVGRALARQPDAGEAAWRDLLRQPAPVDDSQQAQDHFASRQANAALALVRLGRGELVWPLWRQQPDPRVRSFLIHRAAPYGVPADVLIAQFEREPDPSARRALLLALGEYSLDQLANERRQALLPSLLEIYRTDPDPGMHGAVDWLVRRWGQSAELERARHELAGQPPASRNWYVNGHGQTMVIVPGPVTFQVGDPPDQTDRYSRPAQPITIAHSFAIGTHEVTFAESVRFSGEQMPPQYLALPAAEMTWFQIAAYCNWLSQQEGIPPEEWCYESADGSVERLRLAPDFLRRTGYRLPSEDEWEFACRAGTSTRRYYGNTDELLDHYAVYMQGSEFMRLEGGSRKPNDLGLFDVLGNVLEWTLDRMPPGSRLGRPGDWYVVRGGAFWHAAFIVRSSARLALPPMAQGFSNGFRLARTHR